LLLSVYVAVANGLLVSHRLTRSRVLVRYSGLLFVFFQKLRPARATDAKLFSLLSFVPIARGRSAADSLKLLREELYQIVRRVDDLALGIPLVSLYVNPGYHAELVSLGFRFFFSHNFYW